MVAPFTTLVVTLLLPFVLLSPSRQVCDEQLAVQAEHHSPEGAFATAVCEYVELRRRQIKHVPPLRVTDDAAEISAAVAALADAIRAARPAARRGDIVNPEMAGIIRALIGAAIVRRHLDVTQFYADALEEGVPDVWPSVEVNDSFPWSAGAAMWPALFTVLPPLPEELEYRFLGRDLVLVDVDASLVVDVVVNALPAW